MEEKKTEASSAAPEIAAPDESVKRSRRRWRRFLVIYAAVWLLFASLGCAAFYKYLRVYEQALPEHVMDSLMESTAPEVWLRLKWTSEWSGKQGFPWGERAMSGRVFQP